MSGTGQTYLSFLKGGKENLVNYKVVSDLCAWQDHRADLPGNYGKQNRDVIGERQKKKILLLAH